MVQWHLGLAVKVAGGRNDRALAKQASAGMEGKLSLIKGRISRNKGKMPLIKDKMPLIKDRMPLILDRSPC